MQISKTDLIIWLCLFISIAQSYSTPQQSSSKIQPIKNCFELGHKDNISLTILRQEADKQSRNQHHDLKQLIEDSQILEGRFMKQMTQYPNWNSVKCEDILVEPEDEDEIRSTHVSEQTKNELDDFDTIEFWRRSRQPEDPLGQDGIESLSNDEIEKMRDEDIRTYLLMLGENTEGSTFYLRLRLKTARDQKFAILSNDPNTSKPSRPKNPKITREKVSYYNKMVDSISQKPSEKNIDFDIVDRWKTRIDLSEAFRNPAKFFELNSSSDHKALESIQIQNLLNETKNDLEDPDESQDYLADQIPKSFEVDEYPISTDRIIYSDNELSIEDKKKKFLSSNYNGIIKDTIEELSSRFGVSVDFIGDVLCQSGLVGPIPKNKSLKDLVELDIIWDLVELISVSDPIEINEYYITQSIESIMEEFEISEDEITKICNNLNIRLPFSINTYLNHDCYDALLGALKKKDRRTFI